MLSKKQQNRIIRGGIIIFWLLFWLLNTIDKVILKPTMFWVGKNRAEQFTNYFISIGVSNQFIHYGTLILVSLLEFSALVFMVLALFYFFKGNKTRTRHMLFFGILISLIVFSFFAIGDQVFGDRVELLEHSIYWIALIISWFVFTNSESERLDIEKKK